ncbi:Ig-like domain-containing protein [Enterobacter cloacae]
MDGSNVLGTTTAGADGTWSFTPSVDLGRGDHTFTATAKDPMGNESSSSSWTVTIDTDAPLPLPLSSGRTSSVTVPGFRLPTIGPWSSTTSPTVTWFGSGSTVKEIPGDGSLVLPDGSVTVVVIS